MNLPPCLKKHKQTAKKEYILYTQIQELHPHLSIFSLEEILRYFHIQKVEELQTHINILQERQRKQEKNKINPLLVCQCRDAKGQLKDLYAKESFADEKIQYTQTKLKTYLCPYGCGWHLSKI